MTDVKRMFAVVAVAALSTGCMQAVVTASKSPHDNVVGSKAALTKAGWACEQVNNKNVLVCNQEETKIGFVLLMEDMPARVVLVMRLRYESECDAVRAKRMNLFHGRVDYAIAYCQAKTISFVGSYVIPESGLSAKDLTGYVKWWTRATLRAGASVGLFEDDGAGSGGGKAPPPEDDPANDGTKT